jgi:hypothetical protein
MTRMTSGFCAAAALSCFATLGAQTPATSSSAGQRTSADSAKEITITGCLSKGADGKYVLSNAKADNPSATAGTSGSTTPAPATGTPSSGGTSTTGSASSSMNAATSWTLSGGTDLDKHVGHQVQVTGKAAMDSSMDHGRTPDTTASAAGTPATGAVGTSGSTATAATEEQRNKDSNANAPRLDVQSVKMIASTCS